MSYLLEIATNDYTTTQLAILAGADRIELCADIAHGGITSSYAMIKKIRNQFDVALYPIIRPRSGDFLYTTEEVGIMLDDISFCRSIGCDGVVVGALNSDGSIDIEACKRLVEAAYPLDLTFHRAFDRCVDAFEGLEQLIGLGFERVLTSGQQRTVSDGISMIKKLNDAADNRIIIMPGSGVRANTLQTLIDETGCNEFHASCKATARSLMEYIHPAFEHDDETTLNASIDEKEIVAMKKIVEQLNQQ